MSILGIGGMARVGKDTFCSIAINILQKNGFRAKQYSFASALKEEIKDFLRLQCNVDVYTTDTELKKDIRDFLVWYGTTFWRKRDPSRWIRGVEARIMADCNHVDVALISDVRFLNEADWIHGLNGKIVNIDAFKMGPRIPSSSFDDVYPDDPLVKHYIKAPNESEEINAPLVKTAADFKLEWECKGLDPKEATDNLELGDVVFKTLNSISWFNGGLIR